MKGVIKYSYCVDENDELVHIKKLTDATRHTHKLYCLQCGQEMVANLGKKKQKYFSHKAETACGGESYLHKLAKRLIRNKFMKEDKFPVTFSRDVQCNESKKCPCYCDGECIERHVKILRDLKTWNNTLVYDTCKEEVTVGVFRPDLMLSCSTKPDRKPVFIEIYKTHQSDDLKINSDYKIIETKKIVSEKDIEDIVTRGFVEDKNCKTYNFNPPLPSMRKKGVPIDRFVLFPKGFAKVHKASDYVVFCDQLHSRRYPNSVVELNMRNQGIDIWGDHVQNNTLDSYQKGLLYLVKKGMNIRNCILCKYYKYNDFKSHYICILYKTIGLQSPSPMQSMADGCQRFEMNQELTSHPLSELEKDVFEL